MSILEGLPPTQNLPPNEGDGASQLLAREVVPPPHVLVQLVHDSQFSQPPSTKQQKSDDQLNNFHKQ